MNIRPAPRLLAILVAAVLALAACASAGGGASPPAVGTQGAVGSPAGGAGSTALPPGGGSADACSLLIDSEIQAITGHAVATKEPGDPFGVFDDGCNWKLDIGSEIVAPEVGLGVTKSGGKAYFDKYFKPYATEPVSGLGDAAIRDDSSSLMAVKGDVLVEVQFVGGPAGDIPRRLIEAIFAKI
jgi:hypothetical protein